MLKTNSNYDLSLFKRKFEAASGGKLALDYLEKSKVFIQKYKGHIIGGFVINNFGAQRSFDLFVSRDNQLNLHSRFSSTGSSEITCFWMDRKYRRKFRINLLVWFKMSIAIFRFANPKLFYGTNSKGLAKAYNLPTNSNLIHQDVIQGRNTYLFSAKRNHIIMGIAQIIYYKLILRLRATQHRLILKTFGYEVS